MDEHDVIQLDSDEDDQPSASHSSQAATARISIVNSRPLDLRSLGIGNEVKPNVSPEYKPAAASSGPTYRKMANRIKSKSNVPYTQQVLPLRPLSIMGNYHRAGIRKRIVVPTPPQPFVPTPTLPRTEIDWRDTGSNTDAREDSPRPSRELLHRQLHNYNFEAFYSEIKDTDRVKYPNLQFRCTYDGCSHVCTGNHEFTNHLWAHVAEWKDTENVTDADGSEPKNTRDAVERLSSCPQCLARFHTPYLMQVHFTRAHSHLSQSYNEYTCHICERDVGVGADCLKKHIAKHSSDDAPYNCKKCRYRCTIRMQLVDHFYKVHAKTNSLMCPFCTFTMCVPITRYKKASVQTSEDFVEHIRNHEILSRVSCDSCACTFSSHNDKQKHLRDHVSVNSRWTIRPTNPENRSRLQSVAIAVEDPFAPYCSNCNPLPKNKRKKKDKYYGSGMCQKCLKAAFLKSEPVRRTVLYKNVERLGFNVHSCSLNKDRAFKCDCGLYTRNGEKFVLHWLTYKHEYQIVLHTYRPFTPTKRDKEMEELECDIFAIVKKPVPKVEEKKEEVKKHIYARREFQTSLYDNFLDQLEAYCDEPDDASGIELIALSKIDMEAEKDSPKKLFESVKDSLNYEPSKEVKSETGTPNESDEEQSDEEEDDDDDDDDNDGSDNEAGNNADNECDSGDIDDGGVDSPMSIETVTLD